MGAGWTRREVLWAGGMLLVGSGCSTRQRHPTIVHAGPAGPALAAGTGGPTGITYMVEAGDTLASIARRSDLTVRRIAAANRLQSNLIKPGQVLFLPECSDMHADPYAARLARRRAAEAEAPLVDGGSYTLVPRARWTKQSVKSNHRKMGRVTRITLHHTGEHAGMRGLDDVEIVRRIERYHRDGRKWSAIGYHYLIGRDGRVYEGRPADIQGAHVSKANGGNLGISCIGDFDKALPDRRQLGALQRFLDDQRRHYGVGSGRLYGHRDLGTTICPGDRLYAWLQRYKQG